MRPVPAVPPILALLVLLAPGGCAAPPPTAPGAAANRPPGQEQAPPPAWRAFGNEPFWSAHVEGGRLLFTTPEDMEGRAYAGTATVLEDGLQFEGAGVVLRIRAGACSDGMSDLEHAYTARLQLDGARYAGCAEAAK